MGIGVKELVIILLIVLLVFGAKKLKTIGADLGSAVKGFKKGMTDEDENKDAEMKRLAEDKEKDADFSDTRSADARSQAKDKDRPA